MSKTVSNSMPYPHLKYCNRCCMPETNEGMSFDELGICKACRASEEKMRINWAERDEQLREICEKAKLESGDGYDCMIPISGGKDSAFQLHVLTKKYGMKPLAVTHSHNWYSDKGWQNLWNVVERLDVDHVLYTPKRSLVNRMAKKSLCLIGDSCWHCHAGIMAFPLLMATKFNIKLLIWGESPADFSGRDTYFDQKYNMKTAADIADIFMKGSVRTGPDSMVSEEIQKQEMFMYYPPEREDLIQSGIEAIYLGDYLFWDHERQTELLVNEYGWQEDEVEGTFKHYKSVECRMPGVHDHAKWVKRGFGRATDFASQDVRAGLMTREEGFAIASKIDPKKPYALKEYLELTGYTEEEFYDILKSQRVKKMRDLP